MCGDQHVVTSFKSLYKNRIERCGHQGFSEFSLHCPNHAHGQNSIMTPKIAKMPFAETGWLETAPSATQSGQLWHCRDG